MMARPMEFMEQAAQLLGCNLVTPETLRGTGNVSSSLIHAVFMAHTERQAECVGR